MFNALVMSYSRLPWPLAQDGHAANRFFGPGCTRATRALGGNSGWRHRWALCLGLGFERLVTIDILLYGASLSLES